METHVAAADVAALKDMVSGVLERRGAQLRSAVFGVLNDTDAAANPPPTLEAFAALAKTSHGAVSWLESAASRADAGGAGRLAVDLVREFLQFYALEQTLSVFNPESGSPDIRVERAELVVRAGIAQDPTPKRPVLVQLLESPGKLGLLSAETPAPSAPPVLPTSQPNERESNPARTPATIPLASAAPKPGAFSGISDEIEDIIDEEFDFDEAESDFITSDRSITPTRASEGLDVVEVVEAPQMEAK
ncbi:hypothetical protein HK105_206082 [Polyrhizophydium stewartii]|uniref:FGFR1 oncogene partner (FOP) N-terminal dimerisation domain-containing protein n=1 Tax=Polyrhizophydium stewartii TaxID=2732419 RepID=A0ABR4N462_9FUNG